MTWKRWSKPSSLNEPDATITAGGKTVLYKCIEEAHGDANKDSVELEKELNNDTIFSDLVLESFARYP